jgi:hypothetical protein
MKIIERIFDRIMDWSVEHPGTTILILFLVIIGMCFICALLGLEVDVEPYYYY